MDNMTEDSGVSHSYYQYTGEGLTQSQQPYFEPREILLGAQSRQEPFLEVQASEPFLESQIRRESLPELQSTLAPQGSATTSVFSHWDTPFIIENPSQTGTNIGHPPPLISDEHRQESWSSHASSSSPAYSAASSSPPPASSSGFPSLFSHLLSGN